MIVFINAISITEGGSLVVLQNLFADMVHLRPEWQWHVAANSEARARLPDLHNTVFHVYAEHRFVGWKVRLWYETGLPRLIKQVKAGLRLRYGALDQVKKIERWLNGLPRKTWDLKRHRKSSVKVLHLLVECG